MKGWARSLPGLRGLACRCKARSTPARSVCNRSIRPRCRRANSVVKKRSGAHEDTIREFRLTGEGVKIGPPLTQFQGILTGVPDYRGEASPLLPTGGAQG